MSDKKSTGCIFQDLFPKPLLARFDQERVSSDGGAVLLRAAERNLGIIEGLGEALHDKRQQGKVKHDLQELIAQRVYAIACGYPDGNDAARLADDPVHKLLVGRCSKDDDALASQATISRFENSVDSKDVYRMADALADCVIGFHRERLAGKAKRIVIDLDVTDDPTHGGQQLSFFNGYYDTHCYLPLYGVITFDREKEQHLVASMLRPGNANNQLGVLPMLERILTKLRPAFPGAKYLVRLDGGFAFPELFEFLDKESDVNYVVNMPKNKVLKRLVEPAMKIVRRRHKESGKAEREYGSFLYSAGTWKDKKRRVIFKAEVLEHEGREPKDNPRFVVTDLKQTPKHIYEKVYCARGDMENRLKELQHGLNIDRTSCTKFLANQFRLLMTSAAYIIMQEIRRNAAGTSLEKAQVSTIIINLIKLGVRVVVSVRRIVLHLPASFPHRSSWERIALALGAESG